MPFFGHTTIDYTMATIIILDNNVDNLTIWAQDVLQHVSRPKFGIHADHLLLQDVAPTFRNRPHIDDTNGFTEYRYEHQIDTTTVTTPPGIPGRPTVIGEQFFREDMKILRREAQTARCPVSGISLIRYERFSYPPGKTALL